MSEAQGATEVMHMGCVHLRMGVGEAHERHLGGQRLGFESPWHKIAEGDRDSGFLAVLVGRSAWSQ